MSSTTEESWRRLVWSRRYITAVRPTVANFTGAEAEELRRAVGMRRSWERMKNLEGKLRAGMTANDIDIATQNNIVQNISSFALYGFPESHAASFALIAYTSA
jgi:error-prone DNA polymerase